MEDTRKLTIAKADQQKALLARAEDQRKRLELEKTNQIERQLKQAKAHFAKSDFARLSKELKSITGNIVLVNGVVAEVRLAKSIYDFPEYPTLYRKDNDNIYMLPDGSYFDQRSYPFSTVGISLIWCEENSRYKTVEKERPWVSYDVWKNVYSMITIGCDQTGQITLGNSSGDINLPMSKWLGNPDIQEEALGRAYRNPKRMSVKKDNKIPPPAAPGPPPGTPR